MKFIRIFAIIFLAAICLAALVLVYFLSSIGFSLPHQPSDAALETQFNEHRTDFEHLVKMIYEDSNMSRVAPDFTWRQDSVMWPRPESEWGISEQRWNEYKRIFSQTGLKEGMTRPQKSSDVLLDVWTWGIVPAGRSVSFLYCGQPRDVSKHTEAPCIEAKGAGEEHDQYGDGYRYKRIAPDWYIYEESN